MSNGTTSLLFLIFCTVNGSKHGKGIVSNKFKNQRYESNHNSHNCNIEHLIFDMVYHYSQHLPSTVIKEVYKITMPNKAIGMFW